MCRESVAWVRFYACMLQPPELSFRQFRLALRALAEMEQLSGIELEAWRRQFGPAATGQIVSAFHFLGLVDERGDGSPELAVLGHSLIADRWATPLEMTLRRAYAPIFELQLGQTVLSELNQRFEQIYQLGPTRRRKCVEFFLNALRETDVLLSPSLTSRNFGAVARLQQRKESAPQAHEILADKLPAFDPNWPDAVKERWFEGFSKLLDAMQSKS